MAQNASDEKAKKSGLFDDLSLAQVAAGALAAVTSMLLASQIGIYGSVIGVGVGSVVSAVASQLYKKFLQRSADKLRDLHPAETLLMGKSDEGDEDGADRKKRASQADANATAMPAAARRDRMPRADDPLLSDQAVVQRARAERRHKKKFKRGVVIVSIVSALLAVAASAVVIDLVSSGQGVGAKTQPLVSSSRSSSVDDVPGEAVDQGASAGSSADGDSDASKDASEDQPKGSSGGDQGSSGSSSGSGSDSGSSSGDQGSSSSGSSSGSGSGGSSGDSSGGSSSSGSSSGGSGSSGNGGTSGNLSEGEGSGSNDGANGGARAGADAPASGSSASGAAEAAQPAAGGVADAGGGASANVAVRTPAANALL